MKVDTHVHLGGSISAEFVWAVIQEHNLTYLADSYADVQRMMTFDDIEPRNFHRFLDKFRILDNIPWDEELIDRSIAAVCQNLIHQNIDYAWMRFSINKYMNAMKWHKKEAIQFVYNSFQKHAPGRVGLMLSLKYESTRASQKQYATLIEDPEVANQLIGIDLVGDEGHYTPSFYQPLYQAWKKHNKILCAHVGESQSAENVITAIRELEVTHIAHGIKIAEHPEYMQEAKDKEICFDLALTSNLLTGVVPNLVTHPIRKMIDAGLNITLGTDDPVQCSTTLDEEYMKLHEISVNYDEAKAIRTRAATNTRKYGLA